MDLRSSARSRRSKSRTPFAMSESDQDLEEEKYSAVVYSENIKTSSTIVRSSNGKSSFERLSQEQNINSSNTKPVTNRRTKRFSKLYKTSDYSSEDGENEVSSTRSITENERNRMLEDARKAADSSTGITALGLYRKAKQYWEEYPKTDYTYSPFSKDRVEIAPGVVAMPNMSRRHISSYNKYTNTESFSTSELSNFLKTRQPSAEASSFYGVVRRNVLRVLVSILSVLHLFFAPVSHVYRFAHSVCVTLARCIYMATSAVMLLDTWLLRSNRNYGKAAALTALCVIPFLLIGGWWLSLTTRDTDWKSMITSFSTEKNVEEPVVRLVDIESNEHSYRDNQASTEFILKESQLKEILQYVKANLDSNNQIDYQEISRKILETESIQNILNENRENSDALNEQGNIKEIIENQQKSIDGLINELRQLKTEIKDLRSRQANENERNQKIHSESTNRMDLFLHQLNRCCRKAVDLESHMLKTFVAALNDPNFLKNQKGLTSWLNSLFVARTELEDRISQVTQNLTSKFASLTESNSKFLMDQVAAKLKYQEVGTLNGSNVTEYMIKQIVRDTLNIYDADKTGLVDYAMEPMGGQVITTRCTESYHAGTAVVSIFGLPLWYPAASPRTVITPGINPGKCWAFQNFPGILVIKLMVPIKIEAFSYEHVSRLLVPDGKIDSAPRDIEVYGLSHENDKNGIRLGSYRYDYNGESLQFFSSEMIDSVFHYIELRVTSNHGNPNYTCLYRFRVHGKRIS